MECAKGGDSTRGLCACESMLGEERRGREGQPHSSHCPPPSLPNTHPSPRCAYRGEGRVWSGVVDFYNPPLHFPILGDSTHPLSNPTPALPSPSVPTNLVPHYPVRNPCSASRGEGTT